MLVVPIARLELGGEVGSRVNTCAEGDVGEGKTY